MPNGKRESIDFGRLTNKLDSLLYSCYCNDTNMLENKERRKFVRLNAYHLVKYRLISEQKQGLVIASIKDISGGGVCLSVEEELPKGSVLQVYINYPGFSAPIPCLAKVSWSKQIGKTNRYELGLEFLEIEDLLRQEIIQRIDYARRRSV